MLVSGASSQCGNFTYTRNHELIYVNHEGIARGAYHFSIFGGESYANYEKALEWKTDNGKAFPARNPFVDQKFDLENRTFSGSLHWNNTILGGVVRSDLKVTFSKDWRKLEYIGGRSVYWNGKEEEF